MTKRPLLLLLTALALMGAHLGAVAAQADDARPAEAELLFADDEALLAFWVGPDQQTANRSADTIWLGFSARAPPAQDNETADANATDANTTAPANLTYIAYVNLTADDALELGEGSLVLETTGDGTWTYDSVALASTLDAGQGDIEANYTVTADIHRIEDGNATLLQTVTGTGTVILQTGAPIPVPPGDPIVGIPPTYWIAGGAAVLAIGGGTALLLQRQREKQRQARTPRRSSVLRDEALERAALKRPEQAAAVKQELRQQEQVRERRRELQILDAKKADAQKTIDLLKKRREAGGLTEHQYNTMVAKKQADLDRIDTEIAEMEAEDRQRGGNGGAAA